MSHPIEKEEDDSHFEEFLANRQEKKTFLGMMQAEKQVEKSLAEERKTESAQPRFASIDGNHPSINIKIDDLGDLVAKIVAGQQKNNQAELVKNRKENVRP